MKVSLSNCKQICVAVQTLILCHFETDRHDLHLRPSVLHYKERQKIMFKNSLGSAVSSRLQLKLSLQAIRGPFLHISVGRKPLQARLWALRLSLCYISQRATWLPWYRYNTRSASMRAVKPVVKTSSRFSHTRNPFHHSLTLYHFLASELCLQIPPRRSDNIGAMLNPYFLQSVSHVSPLCECQKLSVKPRGEAVSLVSKQIPSSGVCCFILTVYYYSYLLSQAASLLISSIS